MKFDFNLFMEIFGYIGTALVIISMLMTSVVKLRIINICGSFISVIYALVCHAYPVVLLNLSLMTINIFQLIRMRRRKTVFRHVLTTADDPNLAYMTELYGEDMNKYYPEYVVEDTDEVHFVYCGSEIVGFLIGKREGDALQIKIDYATPKFRDLSVSKYLYEQLKESGVASLSASQNAEYFARMGFMGDGMMLKKL